MRWGRVLVVGLVGSTTACWPASGGGPDRTGFNATETLIGTGSVGAMEEAWTVELGDGPVADPVRWNDAVYVSAVDAEHGSRSVYAVGADGSRRWERDGQAGGVEQHYAGELLVDEERVGMSMHEPDGSWWHVWVDGATGTPLWPRVEGRLEAVRCCMSRGDFPPAQGTFAVTLQPDLPPSPQRVPFSMRTGVLDGSLRWGGGVDGDAPLTLGFPPHGAVFQAGFGLVSREVFPPTHGNGIRLIPVPDQGTHCGLNRICLSWARPLDGTSATPVVLDHGDRRVYTATDAGTVYAFTADGEPLWTASVGAPVRQTPALADGWLFVATETGGLHVFAAAGCGAPTCSPVWTATTGSPASAQPAVAGGVVFTGSADGSLDAFPVAGCGAPACPALWSAELGSEITGAPAISGGQVYVGTADGRLVAFAPES